MGGAKEAGGTGGDDLPNKVSPFLYSEVRGRGVRR